MDTGGAKESVHINGLSMLLSGLKLGKMYDKFLSHARTKQTVHNNEMFNV